jgi:hypothetical protein
MVDHGFVTDDDNCPMRKFTTVFDLVYTLFNNNSVEPILTDKMINVTNSQRDGHIYHKHLAKLNDYCNTKFINTKDTKDTPLYFAELRMLRALVADKKVFADNNLTPFNTKAFELKQAQTQVGHYSELRHDNVLYLEEVCGSHCDCEYPDIMVEPVNTFWKEMLNVVEKFITFSKKYENDYPSLKHSQSAQILDKFKEMLEIFIEHTNLYINNKKIDMQSDMMKKLSTIVKAEYHGSGGPSYGGWYMNLFYSDDDALDFNPEIASMFTGVTDDRGDGGIVHIGTGPTQLLYTITQNPNYTTDKDKEPRVFVGPVYSTYEFITDYGTRLNDAEWKNRHNQYKKIKYI